MRSIRGAATSRRRDPARTVPKSRETFNGRGFLALLIALGLGACSSTPGAFELPPDDAEVRASAPADADGARRDGTEDVAAPAEASAGAAPADASAVGLSWTPLEVRGVRGGSLTFDLPLPPREAETMLLDFDAMSGWRSWAPEIVEVAPPEGAAPGSRFARWSFAGEAGVDPVATLEFRGRTDADGARVLRFRLARPDFGLAAFFGDLRITPSPAIDGGARVVQRVFIDSGLWIANASTEDIRLGLEEDARLLLAWAEERAAASRR